MRCEAPAGAASGSGGPWSRLRCVSVMLTAQVGPHRLAASEGERGAGRPRPSPPEAAAARGAPVPGVPTPGSRARFRAQSGRLGKMGTREVWEACSGLTAEAPWVAGHPEPWWPQPAAGKRGLEEPAGPDGAVLGPVQVASVPGQSPLGKQHSASRAHKYLLVYFVASCLFLLSSKSKKLRK